MMLEGFKKMGLGFYALSAKIVQAAMERVGHGWEQGRERAARLESWG